MSKPFYSLSDTNLLAWSNNFSARLTATPAAFGLDGKKASSYAALNAAFDAALTAWRDPITRTPISMANKTAAREALLADARYLVATIDTNPATTDAQRDELVIKARKKSTPIPAPSVSPLIDVEAVNGQVVTLRLHSEGRRGRPAGVQGASMFTFVGTTPPADTAQWKFEGLITRTKFDLRFESSASASTVWVTAFWYNERGQSGTACAPVSINLPAVPVVPVGENMKIAA